MPVTTDGAVPLDYVTISGPAIEALERRKESTSNPKIAAKSLRHNFDHVKDALFAEFKALRRVAPTPSGPAAAVAAGAPFYISDKAIDERAAVLRDIALGLLSSGTLPGDRLLLREGRIPMLTQGYFLLNKAYKDWRIPAGQSNESIRIAALQAMTIARFQPFVPLAPTAAQDLGEARCNEIFALAYGLGILQRNLRLSTPARTDFWLRVLEVIAAARCTTLDPFIADLGRGAPRPLGDYALVVHPDDKPTINSLISIFELIAAENDHLLG